MAISYKRNDSQFFDYGMEKFHGQWFRGPMDQGPDAIAWLGAAQTFGRYVDEPFAKVVGDRLDLGTLNLGSGGKGPRYYLRHPELIEEVNRCRVAVIQVMAARGSDNSLFRSEKGGAKGVRLDTGKVTRSLTILDDLVAEGRSREAHRIARESQKAYLEEMRMLFEAVKPPKIFLWISFRSPRHANWRFKQTLACFPQLVSTRMMNQLKPLADRYVAVVSRAGIPQAIRDDAGNTVRVNGYYPSPEMHRLAADQLTPVVRELIG